MRRLRFGAAMVCVAATVACKTESRAPAADTSAANGPQATSSLTGRDHLSSNRLLI
jgi:hypothetical protein